MTAKVNGVALAATRANAAISGAGNFIVANIAEASGTQVTLRLSSIGKPGTYPLGVGAPVPGGLGDVTIAGATFTTPVTGSAGTVTVTAVSTTRIAGTFSFTATRGIFGGSDAAAVTDGSFDAPVSGTGTLEVPVIVPSTVTGTILGAEFVATGVSVAEPPASGVLNLTLRRGGSDVLTVTVPGISGAGSYPLNALSSRSLRYDAPVNGFPTTWGGTNASSAGSVTITSLTATRVAGTIAATLTPTFAALNTPPCAIALTFDILLP
jgi:hypothetical protein